MCFAVQFVVITGCTVFCIGICDRMGFFENYFCSGCLLAMSFYICKAIGSFCFSPPAWHKLCLCCTRLMAAKLADNKTIVLSFRSEE